MLHRRKVGIVVAKGNASDALTVYCGSAYRWYQQRTRKPFGAWVKPNFFSRATSRA